jgi:hypothetical protein
MNAQPDVLNACVIDAFMNNPGSITARIIRRVRGCSARNSVAAQLV